MNNSEPSAVSLPLSQRAQRLSAPGTSSMRSKANALKEAGVNLVNFAAGELSFDACPVMKAAATDALATALARGLQDEAWRTQAQRAGLERAARFTWERCVQSTVDVYNQLGHSLNPKDVK